MKSRPSTTSRFRLEASASGWKQSAGRRLANTPMPARRPSRPASGRLSRGASVPLAARPPRPSARRLAALAAARVSSVSGVPMASKLDPPNGALVDRQVRRELAGHPAHLGGHFGADPVAGQEQQVVMAAA